MSEKLFIQFQDTNTDQLLWFHIIDDQIHQSGEHSITELASLKEQFPSTAVVVLVPSSDCLVTRVSLPTRQRRQQLKAIPFALEEQIATDIDDMHFAIGKRTGDGHLSVVAVAKTKMQHWIDVLTEADIFASAMLPLAALLEAPEDAWSIFQLGDIYLVNQQDNCWSGSADEVMMMLQLSIQSLGEEDQPGLIFWGSEEVPPWVAGLGLEFSHQTLQDPRQALLTRFDLQNINLLQGDFEVKDDWDAGWNIWRSVAALTLLAVLLKFSFMGFDIYRFNDQRQILKKDIEKTYHLVAPGARIVDPERQMRQLLTQQKGGQFESGSFLVMLGSLADGLASIPGIVPTNLSYDSTRGEIRLDLLVSKLPVLDQLKENLMTKGLSIEVGAASAQGDSYSGRLTIRSGS